MRAERGTHRAVLLSRLTPALIGLCLLALAACGGSTPSPPKAQGGVYTSTAYHFSVTYPDGWQANEIKGQSATAAIPLTVLITRINAGQQSSLISTFTVTVLNVKDPTIAKGIAVLEAEAKAQNSTLTPVTLAGHTALRTQPLTQQLPGASGGATHTDYYLIVGDYEYRLSTDAVEGDDAEPALEAMLQSFTLTR